MILPITMETMTSKYIPYTAGFFDGEGCVSIEKLFDKRREGAFGYQGEFRIRCITSQKFWREPLDIMEMLYEGRVTRLRSGIYQHIVNGKKALSMLELMLPLLTVKREQAELALKFFDMSFEEREEALIDMRRLKRSYDL